MLRSWALFSGRKPMKTLRVCNWRHGVFEENLVLFNLSNRTRRKLWMNMNYSPPLFTGQKISLNSTLLRQVVVSSSGEMARKPPATLGSIVAKWWGNGTILLSIGNPYNGHYTHEKQHDIGKSPCSNKNTSSQMLHFFIFFHCHLCFLGGI